jgi:putative addiction module component (TIGR02574 family)
MVLRAIICLSYPRSFGNIAHMSNPAFDFRKLPLPDRVKLVEDIWDSIAEEANAYPEMLPLSDSQRTELRERANDADAHPDRSVSWERVRKELYNRGG